MLNELGHNLELFEIYQSLFTPDMDTEGALIDVLVDVINFALFTIEFLQSHSLGALNILLALSR